MPVERKRKSMKRKTGKSIELFFVGSTQKNKNKSVSIERILTEKSRERNRFFIGPSRYSEQPEVQSSHPQVPQLFATSSHQNMDMNMLRSSPFSGITPSNIISLKSIVSSSIQSAGDSVILSSCTYASSPILTVTSVSSHKSSSTTSVRTRSSHVCSGVPVRMIFIGVSN